MTSTREAATECPVCGGPVRRLKRTLRIADNEWANLEPNASKCDLCPLIVMDSGEIAPGA